VKTPKWDTGAQMLVPPVPMNSGKLLTGKLPNHLHLHLDHGVECNSSNKWVTAMNILSSPTPTVPSMMVTRVWLIVPLKDLILPIGVSHPDTAIVNTTPWVTSAMTSELLTHTNSGWQCLMTATGTVIAVLKMNKQTTTTLSMAMLTSNNMVTAMTPLNSPTLTVPSISLTDAQWTALTKDHSLSTGPSHLDTAIASTWKWELIATISVLKTTMNSGELPHGISLISLLPLLHLLTMVMPPSNKWETAMIPLNSPTPTVNSIPVKLAFLIALPKVASLPTGPSNQDGAIANIWKWDNGAMMSVPLTIMNSGKHSPGISKLLKKLPSSMAGLHSNNMEIAMTLQNSPTLTVPSPLEMNASWTALFKILMLPTGQSAQVTVTVNTWRWDHGAMTLVPLTLMNFGKHLTGTLTSLLLPSHHLMVGLASNNMVTAMTPPNSLTPTDNSNLDMTASWTVLPKDLMLPTMLWNRDTATVSTWQWEPGAMILVPLITMNSGKLLTGGLLNHPLPSHHLMDGLPSNN